MKLIKTFVISTLIIWGLLMLLPEQPVTPEYVKQDLSPKPTYARNAEVDQMFSELGVTDVDAIEVKVTDTIPCDFAGSIRGCALTYDDHMTIFLTSNWVSADAFRKRATLAHEYLHWKWYKGDRANNDDLMRVYNSDRYLQSRVENYNKLGIGSEAFMNEVNSIVCTEYADSALPFTLVDYCTSTYQAAPLYQATFTKPLDKSLCLVYTGSTTKQGQEKWQTKQQRRRLTGRQLV